MAPSFRVVMKTWMVASLVLVSLAAPALAQNRQVRLHVTVAEVNDLARKEIGFDLYGSVTSTTPWLDGTLSGGFLTTKTAGPTTDGFFDYIRSRGDLQLSSRWRALEQRGDIRLLANPVVVANSGDSASFHSGGEIPVPVPRSLGTAEGGGTITIQWRKYGVQIDFRPTVYENDIHLRVSPEVSQLDYANAIQLDNFVIPALATRSAFTSVTMKSGEFLVIGGLKLREKSRRLNRVPVLGQIPILGFFFRNTVEINDERELLVVVSPEIVTPEASVPALPTDRPERK